MAKKILLQDHTGKVVLKSIKHILTNIYWVTVTSSSYIPMYIIAFQYKQYIFSYCFNVKSLFCKNNGIKLLLLYSMNFI